MEGGQSEPCLCRPSVTLPSMERERPFSSLLTLGCALPAAFGFGCDPRPHLLASKRACPGHGHRSVSQVLMPDTMGISLLMLMVRCRYGPVCSVCEMATAFRPQCA